MLVSYKLYCCYFYTTLGGACKETFFLLTIPFDCWHLLLLLVLGKVGSTWVPYTQTWYQLLLLDIVFSLYTIFAYTHLTTSQLPHSYKLVYTPAVPAPTSAESELFQRTNSASAKLYLDIDIYIWLPN